MAAGKLVKSIMFCNYKKMLVLAPHTDDGELGCGGTIVKFIKAGGEVFCAAFSSAGQSVPAGFAKDILKKEAAQAAAALGLNPNHLVLFDYPVRNFSEHRQRILEDLIVLRDRIRPDLVLLPSSDDIHQDHEVISREGFRAFKNAGAGIFGYELPWNNPVFRAEVFIVLRESDLAEKKKALACYKSQQAKFYMSDEFMAGLARIRGGQAAGTGYAEAFQILKLIIK